MLDTASHAPWQEPTWLEQVSQWLDCTLAEQGLRRVGSLEPPTIRPWSAMIRVPTNGGDLYFKASAPVFSYEPALTQTLARWYPADIVPVVAIEPARR